MNVTSKNEITLQDILDRAYHADYFYLWTDRWRYNGWRDDTKRAIENYHSLSGLDLMTAKIYNIITREDHESLGASLVIHIYFYDHPLIYENGKQCLEVNWDLLVTRDKKKEG